MYEIADRIGLGRSRIGHIESAAVAKLRALVFGTDDFPMLREAFAGALAEAAIEKDVALDEAKKASKARYNAKVRRRSLK